MLRSFLIIALLAIFNFTSAQCELNEVFIITNTGTWANEMSWSLTDEEGNEVANFQGVNDFSTDSLELCLPDGCYLVTALDSWGDGWNGGMISVQFGEQILDYELEEGAEGFLPVDLNGGGCIFEIEGCTDPEAENYLEEATIDDGSCYYYLTYTFDGVSREYLYYEPADIGENAPLVFVLHGYTGNMWGIANYSEMNMIAQENGFAVCYPQGLPDNYGTSHWNAGLTISSVDDLGFLTDLAGFLQQNNGLSPECTFACGMSNGGFMSYHLACKAPEVFRAIASVTGSMSGADWLECSPVLPVPVLEIHGTADNIVPWDGIQSSDGGWGPCGSSGDVIDFWVDQNQCTEETEFDFPNEFNDGIEVHANRHTNGFNGNEVWLYTVEGGDHSWPGAWGAEQDIHASREVWDFFSRACSSIISVDEEPQNRLMIYPNPSFGSVIVESNGKGDLQVFSLDGRLVLSERLNNGQNEINLPSGVFIAKVINEFGETSQTQVVVY